MKAKIMLIFSANQRHFHLQKSLDSFDKNSADKNLIQKDKEWKMPYLMPIRAIAGLYLQSEKRDF